MRTNIEVIGMGKSDKDKTTLVFLKYMKLRSTTTKKALEPTRILPPI